MRRRTVSRNQPGTVSCCVYVMEGCRAQACTPLRVCVSGLIHSAAAPMSSWTEWLATLGVALIASLAVRRRLIRHASEAEEPTFV